MPASYLCWTLTYLLQIFFACVHDTGTYKFLNMLILTSTLYHQQTVFTTFLHKPSFMAFVLKTSFTPFLYESTLASKIQKCDCIVVMMFSI